VSDIEKTETPVNKEISFAGRVDTHKVRAIMYEKLKSSGVIFSNNLNIKQYSELICSSKFSLCPRGYGTSSFRTYEVMKLGSIPIIINSGKEWRPFSNHINWDEVSIQLNISEIDLLFDIVKTFDDKKVYEYKQRIHKVCETYFTGEGICDTIKEYL
jgi:hypothetical protein